jgi:hypothetical protein
MSDLEWKRNFVGWSTIGAGTGWSRLDAGRDQGLSLLYLDVIDWEGTWF